MDSVELKTILDLHEKWIRKEPDGKRADLSWSDLRYWRYNRSVQFRY